MALSQPISLLTRRRLYPLHVRHRHAGISGTSDIRRLSRDLHVTLVPELLVSGYEQCRYGADKSRDSLVLLPQLTILSTHLIPLHNHPLGCDKHLLQILVRL